MSKTNEAPDGHPDDIVSMNFSLKRHERDAIRRRAKAIGIPAFRYLIEIGVSGKLPKKAK